MRRFGLLIEAADLAFWLVRKKTMRADSRQKYLARLLVVSGSAFDDHNHALYAATMREIVNIMRSERWGRAEIESRMLKALSIAKVATSPELFDKASRLAQNIIQVSAKSPTVAS